MVLENTYLYTYIDRDGLEESKFSTDFKTNNQSEVANATLLRVENHPKGVVINFLLEINKAKESNNQLKQGCNFYLLINALGEQGFRVRKLLQWIKISEHKNCENKHILYTFLNKGIKDKCVLTTFLNKGNENKYVLHTFLEKGPKNKCVLSTFLDKVYENQYVLFIFLNEGIKNKCVLGNIDSISLFINKTKYGNRIRDQPTIRLFIVVG